MQENEAPKPEETDPNSFRKAVEIVFNEVYSSVVPEKSIESQNLMKFEEKFQKAMQQMTAAKTEPSPVYEPYLQENIVDKELLKSQSGLLRVRGRPAQRRSHNPENKKGLGLKGFKVDGRRTKSKMIGGAILPRANIYMPKRRSRSIIPDVTEVIVNKRRKSSGSMYRTSRRINLDYLWMMHWKLKSRKKVPKKYSTRDILFRMLSKWRKSQDKG